MGHRQKDRWLRGIATGEAVFSESISEKNAGSSFKAMTSTATRHGGDWLITGRKTHVNLGADCDVTLFYAIAEEGLTSFLVDMSLPGIESGLEAAAATGAALGLNVLVRGQRDNGSGFIYFDTRNEAGVVLLARQSTTADMT